MDVAPLENRILGVLGGMGPLASAQFMVRLTLLTEAHRDQDHIPTILWSDPRVPDRSRGRASIPDPLPWLQRGMRGLRAAGCGAIAIPCNTAHGWFEDLAAEGLPILHIVDASAELMRTHTPPGHVIGVMGTAATLAMRLYQDRLEQRGWSCIEPSTAEMAALVSPAIASVKANQVAAAYAPLADAVASLAARGARAVVLGCTEIPLGIQAGPWQALEAQLGIRLVDSIDALALTAIAWAKPGITVPA